MKQTTLLDGTSKKGGIHSLGRGYILEIDSRIGFCKLLHRNNIIKTAKQSDKVEMKILVVEAVNLKIVKARLAEALNISRQTIHNYCEIYHHFGMRGLIHGYNLTDSNSEEKQRQIHADKRIHGNKAKQVAEIRAASQAAEQEKRQQSLFNFSRAENDRSEEVSPSEQPFAEAHEWEETRYAGCFIYWIALIDQWNWLSLVIQHFGSAWRIFSVFVLMSGLNIRSIEQLKNVRKRESGRVLGLKRLPGKTLVWSWFYEAAIKKCSKALLKEYFLYQIRAGLVRLRLWFIDGHLLPYTGKEKLHYSYNTQRQIPVPGRTNQVTCDDSGRIVSFVIEEGKGDMKQQIIDVVQQHLPELPTPPVVVFDREGYDKAFFSQLIKAEQPFVTWEKNINKLQLEKIAEEKFTQHFEFNGKRYSVFEQEKKFMHQPKDEEESHTFNLRHLIIWNHASNRRTASLAYSASSDLDTSEAVQAILSRWGASENTFKHLQQRHPFHYHPGFSLENSDKQEIANPEIKIKTTLISRLQKAFDRLLRKSNKLVDTPKKDGVPRKNSHKQQVQEDIRQTEAELAKLREEKNALPKKIDVTTLADYRSFKKADNEGKYLFDFVTTSIWNARKKLIDWLGESYDNGNDLVDLFYAITHCHGWIRSTDKEVKVRLEPLQQARRRGAQEVLCRKLSSLGAQIPMGKLLVVEVGESPI